ncbi:protein of unknown function DUF600 [Escherichia phage CJ19]|nr:protein of unknown function DUF600 [Escherichia phage CJ19]
MINDYEIKKESKIFNDSDGDSCCIYTRKTLGVVTVEMVIEHESGAFPMRESTTVRAMGEHLIKMADYMERHNEQ